MTTPDRSYGPQNNETEAERVAREQKETQAASGKAETRDYGSTNAQNTPGPETQPNQR